MILAFQCPPLEQNGILESQVPGLGNASIVKRSGFGKDRVVQSKNELHFSKDVESKELKVTLMDVISREPAMIGRSTVVLNAKPQAFRPQRGFSKKTTKLVVKVSWPTSGRVSETEFLKKACAAATDEHAWAANRLPRVYCAEDITPGGFDPGIGREFIRQGSDFEDFCRWLKHLQRCFHLGFKAQPSYDDDDDDDDDEVQDWETDLIGASAEPPDFDDETLGGFVTYSAMIKPTRHLDGKLKGLVIRDPLYPEFPTC